MSKSTATLRTAPPADVVLTRHFLERVVERGGFSWRRFLAILPSLERQASDHFPDRVVARLCDGGAWVAARLRMPRGRGQPQLVLLTTLPPGMSPRGLSAELSHVVEVIPE